MESSRDMNTVGGTGTSRNTGTSENYSAARAKVASVAGAGPTNPLRSGGSVRFMERCCTELQMPSDIFIGSI